MEVNRVYMWGWWWDDADRRLYTVAPYVDGDTILHPHDNTSPAARWGATFPSSHHTIVVINGAGGVRR